MCEVLSVSDVIHRERVQLGDRRQIVVSTVIETATYKRFVSDMSQTELLYDDQEYLHLPGHNISKTKQDRPFTMEHYTEVGTTDSVDR